jgi:chromodomain-helicase-DNA-binding protein 4
MEFTPNFEDDDEYVRLFLKKGKNNKENEDSKVDELNRHARFYRYGVRPEWLEIHRIIQHKSVFGRVEYLVRWKDIPCDGATWMKEENEFKIPEFDKHVEIYKEYRFALTGEGDLDEDDPNL